MTNPNDELWIFVGAVPLGRYPDERFGFGIETENSKTKIGTTIQWDFAQRIISDHNRIILKQIS